MDPNNSVIKRFWCTILSETMTSNHKDPTSAYIVVLDIKSGYPDNSLFFLFLHKNICCGYSLEAPGEALLMSTHNICFCAEIRNILILLGWIKPFI